MYISNFERDLSIKHIIFKTENIVLKTRVCILRNRDLFFVDFCLLMFYSQLIAIQQEFG